FFTSPFLIPIFTPHPSHPSLLRHGLRHLRLRCRNYDDVAAGPSTSSSSPEQPESPEQQGVKAAAVAQPNNSNSHRRSSRHQPTDVSTRFNVPELSSGDMRDDVWSCLVLVTFWFFGQISEYPFWIWGLRMGVLGGLGKWICDGVFFFFFFCGSSFDDVDIRVLRI
ncbi:hypothetical protein Droror1_Dr00008378, partial [Drosera rotundifolia]